MPISEKPTFTTRKHLARLDRERIQRRYLLTATAVVAFLVVALISFGLLDNLVLKFNAPVAQVGDKIVSVHDYQVESKFQRLNLIQQFEQYYQFLQQFQGDPFGLTPQLQQISTQLTQPTLLGKDVIDRMVGDLVIEREALKRGITVTEAEVDAFIQRYYGYFPNGTQTPTLTSTPWLTSTLSAAQLNVITLAPSVTPGPSLTPTITFTPTITLTPTHSATPGVGTPTAVVPTGASS